MRCKRLHRHEFIKNPPTLADVARTAQVSTATISRSINQPEKVAESTRNRIQQVIEQLGYTPNFGGQALASNRSNTVGAVIPTMNNAMFASALQVFQEVLSESSINLLVASSGYSAESELRQIRSLIARGADGLLLIGSARPDTTTEFLQLRNIPYVIAWSYLANDERTFAGFDNVSAASQITKEVLQKGHTKIAMIAGKTQNNDRAKNRIKGVTKTLAQQNLQLLETIETGYSIESGGDAFETLMTRAKKPSAVICGNDVLAAGAIVRANQLGIKVPEKVSITGFDDIALASVVTPALTTVKVPQLEMGKAAAKLLLQKLSQQTPASIELQTEVVMRQSLAKTSTG